MNYEKLTPDSADLQSLTPIEGNLAALQQLFPSVVREGKVDFDALRQLLGDDVAKDDELFGLQWHGKARARRHALTPSLGTLRPCKEESKNWDTTKNLYIEGDNLEVLKLLQKSYSGKVKMIYIDPPYNTGNEFVYPDDYVQGIENYIQLTNQQDKFKANAEVSGRLHTDWLNMMYPRLLLARELLSDDGVIFISIGEEEINHLKSICDEILGNENLATVIHCQMSTTQGMKVKAAQQGNIVKNTEYILCYTKDGHKNVASECILYDIRPKYDEHYSLILKEDGSIGQLTELYNYRFPNDCDNVKPLKLAEAYEKSAEFAEIVRTHLAEIVRTDKITGFDILDTLEEGKWKTVERDGKTYILTLNAKGNIQQLLQLKDSWGPTDGYYRKEGLRKIRGDWWEGFYIDMGNVGKEGEVDFKNGKKPIRLIEQLCKMTCPTDALVLDFFSGSATTAHAIMKQNTKDGGKRQFIMVQLPEPCEEGSEAAKAGYANICEIGKERIRRAGEKVKEEAGLAGQDLDIGFRVFKLDRSNVVPWDTDAGQLGIQLENESNLRNDRSSEDIFYEVLLKQGIELTEDSRSREIAGHTVYSLGYGQFYCCFDGRIGEEAQELAAGIALWHEEEDPEGQNCIVYVRDSAFDAGDIMQGVRGDAGDARKTSFCLTLEQSGIMRVKGF